MNLVEEKDERFKKLFFYWTIGSDHAQKMFWLGVVYNDKEKRFILMMIPFLGEKERIHTRVIDSSAFWIMKHAFRRKSGR